jgi:hypothetical protein
MPAIQDGRKDFDFLMGHWTTHQKRLRERLKGSTEWEEFDGTSVVRPILGGLGNVEEITVYRESGVFEGFTLRLYNPETQQWSIYWASSASPAIDTPMMGQFENGRGEFYAQELFEGKAVFVRFIWLVIDETNCHWEQAFSPDGGKTWETNWIMTFKRIPEA